MLESFSSGYYRSKMRIERYDDGPAMELGTYDFINRNVYLDSDIPVTISLSLDLTNMFHPTAESAMPTDVLGLPEDMINKTGDTWVYVVEPEYVKKLGKYYG